MSEQQSLIQGVIFDFGRVLAEFDFRRFYEVLKKHSSLSPDAFETTIPEAGPLNVAYETGTVTSREYYEGIVRLAGLTMTEQEFMRAYSDIFTPIDFTWSVVRQLKGHFRLGLLSNTTEWHFEYWIKTVPIFPLFESVTLSYVVRAMKPDPLIYRAALAAIDLPAETCVFIDDIEENAAAARALGMHGFRYTTPGRLISDFASVGIQIHHS